MEKKPFVSKEKLDEILKEFRPRFTCTMKREFGRTQEL